MKPSKTRSLLLTALLLACLLSFAAPGALAHSLSPQAAVEERQVTGLDIVVLIDATKSMLNNDPGYRRLDAAALLANMCDMQDSYMGVITFGGLRHGIGEDCEVFYMQPMNVVANHKRISDFVLNTNKKAEFTGTNIRPALLEAQRMLTQRRSAGSRNEQIIIVLCDGAFEYASGSTDLGESKIDLQFESKTFTWSGGEVTIDFSRYAQGTNSTSQVGNTGRTYKEWMDLYQTYEARQLAQRIKDEGCEIYCIGLQAGTSDVSAMQFLQDVASPDDDPSAASHFRNNVPPDELPDYFSEILASIIGSTIRRVDAESATGGSMKYEVFIPNESVMECNIPIMRDQIKDGAFSVWHNNSEVTQDASQVYAYSGEQFDYVLVKLIEPSQGEWEVRYTPSDSGRQSAKPVNVLYNYDFLLMAQQEYENGQDRGSAAVYSKNDTLYLSAWFADGTGRPIADTTLYQYADDEHSADYITATAVFTDADGHELARAPMRGDQAQGKFALQTPLSEITTNACDGVTITVHATSSSMQRQVEIGTFDVTNHSPVLQPRVSGAQRLIWINNPVTGEAATTLEAVDLSAIFTDADACDTLAYFFCEQASPSNPLPRALDNAVVTAQIDVADKLNIASHPDSVGAYSFIVRAEDSDAREAYADLRFEGEVKSLEDEFARHVTVHLEWDEANGDALDVGKEETVHINLRLRYDGAHDDQVVIDEAVYKQFTPDISVRYTPLGSDQAEAVALAFAYNPEKGCMSAPYTTADVAGTYAVCAGAGDIGGQVACGAYAAPLAMASANPLVFEGQKGGIEINRGYLSGQRFEYRQGEGGEQSEYVLRLNIHQVSLPWFWRYDKTTEPTELSLVDCFIGTQVRVTDISPVAYERHSAKGIVERVLSGIIALFEHDDAFNVSNAINPLLITPRAHGEGAFTVTAQNVDGETKSLSVRVIVASAWWLLLSQIIAVILFVIIVFLLCLLIYWTVIRKRWRGGTLQVIFNNQDLGGVTLPRKGKAQTTLKALFATKATQVFGAPGAIAQPGNRMDIRGEVNAKLDTLVIRPSTRGSLLVCVRRGKKSRAQPPNARLGSAKDAIGRRRRLWTVNAKLTVHMLTNPEVVMEWRLVRDTAQGTGGFKVPTRPAPGQRAPAPAKKTPW